MKTEADTAVYALTQQGAMTAAKIASVMQVDLYLPPFVEPDCPVPGTVHFNSLRALVAESFSAYRRHIFITAAGVAVRCIAPHLSDKRIDPAIVVLDHHGRNVVSLLSGHLGGANALAHEVADILDGQAVITTATDTERLPSLDILALESNLVIANVKAVAKINSALLAGRPVILDDLHNHLKLKGSAWKDLFIFAGSEAHNALCPEEAEDMVRVTVTPGIGVPSERNLILHPKVLHVGIGCRRGIKSKEIIDYTTTTLTQLGLATGSIASIASAEVKQFEPGLHEAAAELGVPLKFFSVKDLDTVQVTNVSPKAQEVFGLDGVCEPAAVLAAGQNGILRLPKCAGRGITIAVVQEMPDTASHV